MKLQQFLVFLFLLFSFYSCGGEAKTVESSQIVKRQGMVYEINQEEPFTGKVVDKYPNGQIKGSAELEKGKANGKTVIYYENGQIKESMDMVEGDLVGEYKKYAENGQILEEGTFKGFRNPEGRGVKYYENGNKKEEGEYKDGHQVGKWISYYENGNKRMEGEVKRDAENSKIALKQGIWIEYGQDGKKVKELDYSLSQIEPKITEFDSEGKIKTQMP